MTENETRVYLLGTEAEMRKVSAADFINARAEAKKLSLASDGDEVTESIAFWAGLVKAAAYDGDEPMFSSLDDVLQRLSAGEIAELTNEIGIPEIPRIIGIEDSRRYDDGTAFGDRIQEISYDAESVDTSPHTNDQIGLPQMRQYDAPAESETAYHYSGSFPYENTVPYFEELRDLSNKFERDSRRYDSLIY